MRGILDKIQPPQFPEELQLRIKQIHSLLDYPALHALLEQLMKEIAEKPLSPRFKTDPLSPDRTEEIGFAAINLAAYSKISTGAEISETDIKRREILVEIDAANRLVTDGIEKLVEAAIHLAASQSGE